MLLEEKFTAPMQVPCLKNKILMQRYNIRLTVAICQYRKRVSFDHFFLIESGSIAFSNIDTLTLTSLINSGAFNVYNLWVLYTYETDVKLRRNNRVAYLLNLELLDNECQLLIFYHVVYYNTKGTNLILRRQDFPL